MLLSMVKMAFKGDQVKGNFKVGYTVVEVG